MFKYRQGRVGAGAPNTYHAHTRVRARRGYPELATLSDPPTLLPHPAPRSIGREGRGEGQILKIFILRHRWESASIPQSQLSRVHARAYAVELFMRPFEEVACVLTKLVNPIVNK